MWWSRPKQRLLSHGSKTDSETCRIILSVLVSDHPHPSANSWVMKIHRQKPSPIILPRLDEYMPYHKTFKHGNTKLKLKNRAILRNATG
jgi:hypothetical protein